MTDLPAWTYLLLIPFVWCGLSWLLSRLSGWHRLAVRYRRTEPINGESAALRSGKIGPVTYHSSLRFQINEEGLGISVGLLLRMGHPPLFIPWKEFHRVSEDDLMYSHRVKASIGDPALIRITLPGWVRYRMPLKLRPIDRRLADEE